MKYCLGVVWSGPFHSSLTGNDNLNIVMDNSDLKEVHRILRRNEEITQANSSTLMFIPSKIIQFE